MRRKRPDELEGWESIKELQPNGKIKKRLIYKGDYYDQPFTRGVQIKIRILYSVLFILSAVCFVISAAYPAACNVDKFISMFSLLCLAGMIMVLYVLIFYVPHIGRMTTGDYKTLHMPLWRNTVVTAVLLWINALAAFIYYFIKGAADYHNILCAIGYLVSGALLFVIFKTEHKIEYTLIRRNESDLDHLSDDTTTDEDES